MRSSSKVRIQQHNLPLNHECICSNLCIYVLSMRPYVSVYLRSRVAYTREVVPHVASKGDCNTFHASSAETNANYVCIGLRYYVCICLRIHPVIAPLSNTNLHMHLIWATRMHRHTSWHRNGQRIWRTRRGQGEERDRRQEQGRDRGGREAGGQGEDKEGGSPSNCD